MLQFKVEHVSACRKYIVRKDVNGKPRQYVAVINGRVCHHGTKAQCLRHCQTVQEVTPVIPVKGTTPINLKYPHAECPKCAEPIDDNAVAGDKCEQCDFVFEEPK